MSTSKIADAWREVVAALGYSDRSPHLKDSPERVARFMDEWHTLGDPPPVMTVFDSDADEMVVVAGLTFYSMCAHHGLPFFGTAYVGYVPDGRILGLSKFARAIDHHAHRFQTQEHLTRDVAWFLEGVLKPRGLGVVMRAEHLCMSMRGVQKPGHVTSTKVLLGCFRDSAVRAEFLASVR